MTTMMLAPLPKGVEDTPEIREALQRWCDGRAEAAVRETPRRLIAKWREYANKAERHIADAGMEIENETHMRDMRMCADELEAASEPPTQPATPTTFTGFSAMNRTRCEAPTGFNHPLSGWTTSDWFTAIMGELGEAANVAKKLNRVRDGIPGNKEKTDALKVKLRQELGDTFVYLDLLAQSLGFNIGAAAQEVFDEKSKEIGYEAAAAPTGQSCVDCDANDRD